MPKPQDSLVSDHNQLPQLLEKLADTCMPLWEGGKRTIPVVTLDENLEKTLAFVRRCGSLRVGLEQIQTVLEQEEAGLTRLAQLSVKKIQSLDVGVSISRLLIISNDGSERFNRHCETLLNLYSHRLLGIKFNVPAGVLGQIFFGREKMVKSLLVNQKDAVLRVLSSIP